jgi:hypothetical protein
VRFHTRNFYGVLRVRDVPATDRRPAYRELMHGSTIHGLAILETGRLSQPTAYFGPESGVGVALLKAREQGPLNVGIIGLGAGTLAGYGREGDRYTFYELDPLVTRVAQAQFAFLRDSRA